MSKSAIAGSAFFALASPIMAQTANDVQASNTKLMGNVITALKNRDVNAITQVDSDIDYAPDAFKSSFISPQQAVTMFEGCSPADMGTAQRFEDVTILRFACPGRKIEGPCSTGDLEIMIYHQPELSLGVMERQRIGPDCKFPAPPAPPLPSEVR